MERIEGAIESAARQGLSIEQRKRPQRLPGKEKESGGSETEENRRVVPDTSEKGRVQSVEMAEHHLKFEVVKQVNGEGNVERKVVVSVLDNKTGEVIRRVPPEELGESMRSRYMGMMLDRLG
jgi:uncharacterized FlaG/YvyC family protein